MEVYGLGIVAATMFIGLFIGDVFGKALSVSGNVGGVGIAMLILIILTNYIQLDERTKNGIRLLSNLYIPIIVAMAAIQDVVSALKGGWVAFLAGGVATVASFFLVPVLAKSGKKGNLDNKEAEA